MPASPATPERSPPAPDTTAVSAPGPTRLLLPALIALTLLIGASGLAVFRSLGQDLRHETERTLAVIAEQRRNEIETWLERTRRDAELFFSGSAQPPALFGHWLAGGRRDAGVLTRLRQRLTDLMQGRGWDGLVLYDAAGEPVLVLGDGSADVPQDTVADLVRRPEVRALGLHRDAHNRALFTLLAPLGQSDTGALGAVALTWRADRSLFPMVGSWPVPTGSAETYLVERAGDRVRFLTPLRFAAADGPTPTRPLDRPDLPAARAVRGLTGPSPNARDYRGEPVLAYSTAITATPWFLVAEIDRDEAEAGIRTTAWVTALVAGLGLFLVYVSSYLLWRVDRGRREAAAETARRAAEARFRVIFEEAPLGMALVDADTGRIREANRRFADILGRRPADLPNLEWTAITHPEDLATSRAQWTRLAAGETPDVQLAKRYLRPDGSAVWVDLRAVPVVVAPGARPMHLSMIEDITERQRYEQALQEARDAAQEASRAKSDFLAHMSHELRTPLNGVLGLAQVLAREPLTSGQHEMVARILGSGQSLLAILNEVLDLSRIEAGALHLEAAPFDPDALLTQVEALADGAARAKGLELRIARPAVPAGRLLGDALRLEQVLQNLLGNAVKFTTQGWVQLRVEVCDPTETALRLRFEVADSGIGIGPAALARLFTPFTQADSGITRRFGGTGLGLAIAKRLVEAMGGCIGAESTEGQGSRFWFEVPFTRSAPDALEPLSSTAAAGQPGRRLAGMQLLVAEDSDTGRDLLAHALTQEGARVTLTRDGAAALATLRAAPADFTAVLMDIQMPVMDGLTATRLIRNELGLRDLPVIALTAGVFEEQKAAALAAGVDAILGKPLDLERLMNLIVYCVPPAAVPGDSGDAPPAVRDLGAPPPTLDTLDDEQFQDLRTYLRENNLRALQLVEDLRPALATALGEPRAATLARAVRALRFGEALRLIEGPPAV